MDNVCKESGKLLRAIMDFEKSLYATFDAVNASALTEDEKKTFREVLIKARKQVDTAPLFNRLMDFVIDKKDAQYFWDCTH